MFRLGTLRGKNNLKPRPQTMGDGGRGRGETKYQKIFSDTVRTEQKGTERKVKPQSSFHTVIR